MIKDVIMLKTLSCLKERLGRGMKKDLVRVTSAGAPVLRQALTPAQFGDLAELPPELEWLANLTNPKTRRAHKYRHRRIHRLRRPRRYRGVARRHPRSRHRLEKGPRKTRAGHSSVRRKLAAREGASCGRD